MKTETQTTKANVKYYKEYRGTGFEKIWLVKCQEHKSSCQRFLEFLEAEYDALDKMSLDTFSVLYKIRKRIFDKITDLKQAIKLYNEAGI